jgi:hypothetical protein
MKGEKMASYRKRAGKWEVRIRKNKSHAICKTFIAKEDAIKWARGCIFQVKIVLPFLILLSYKYISTSNGNI